MRRVADIAGALIAVALCAVLLWPRGDDGAQASPTLALSAKGAVSIANSKDGRALMGAKDWKPGDEVTGRVAIRNLGKRRAKLFLSARAIRDLKGSLSGAMRMRVERVRVGKVVYRGPLRKMVGRLVSRIGPGATQNFKVTARYPRRFASVGEDSELRFGLRWRAGGPK